MVIFRQSFPSIQAPTSIDSSRLSWFFVFFVLASSFAVEAAVVCPPSPTTTPCTCTELTTTPGTNGTIFLTCFNLKLLDWKVSEILDAFLTTPGVSPIGKLDLGYNQLTYVPSQINFFTQLSTLSLSNNLMTTISPGSFKGNGYGNGTFIILTENKLSRFESAVFQPLLEMLEPFADYTNAYVMIDSMRFECSDCHLAWLIRDNRHLLPVILSGVSLLTPTCTNGTYFHLLNPNGYADCPSFVCPLDYDGVYADPVSCSAYYNCISNIAYPNECPTGFVFNAETEKCDLSTNVAGRCGLSTTTTTATSTSYSTLSTTSSTNTIVTTTTVSSSTYPSTTTSYPTTSFVCPGPDGYFADPLSCSSYYLCLDNTPYFEVCPPNYVFNPDIGRCDTEANVPSCQKPFVCPGSDGYFADPYSCNNYYLCLDSTPFLETCPPNYVFNPAIDRCDNPANVPSCQKPFVYSDGLNAAYFP